MKNLRLLFLLGGLALSALPSLCWGQSFHLQAPDGELKGPYTLRDGDIIKIGRLDFVMRTLPDPTAPNGRAIASQIRIDGLDFQQVDVRDALDSLTIASKRRDPRGKGLTLKLAAQEEVARMEGGTLMVRPPAPIYLNMVMRNVTLAEVVETIGEATGLEARYEGENVFFSRRWE